MEEGGGRDRSRESVEVSCLHNSPDCQFTGRNVARWHMFCVFVLGRSVVFTPGRSLFHPSMYECVSVSALGGRERVTPAPRACQSSAGLPSLPFPSPVLPEEGAAFFRRLVSKHIALIFHGCAFFLLLLVLFSLGCVPLPTPTPPFV